MTQRIAYPDNPVMALAWVGFISYLADQPAALEAFKAHTGYDLSSVIRARGLNRMIDESTGYDKTVINAFIDWANEFHWGENPFAEEAK